MLACRKGVEVFQRQTIWVADVWATLGLVGSGLGFVTQTSGDCLK